MERIENLKVYLNTSAIAPKKKNMKYRLQTMQTKAGIKTQYKLVNDAIIS